MVSLGGGEWAGRGIPGKSMFPVKVSTDTMRQCCFSHLAPKIGNRYISLEKPEALTSHNALQGIIDVQCAQTESKMNVNFPC